MTPDEITAFTENLCDRLPNKMEMVGYSWSRRWDAYRFIIPAVINALGMESKMRLYVGLALMQNSTGDTIAITFADWAENESDAKGRWVTHALEKNKGYSIFRLSAQDITELAINHP